MSVYFSISWGYKSTLTLSTCQINNWRGKITKRKKNIIGCVVYFIITIYRYIHLCTNIQFLHVLFTYLQFIRVAPGRECPYYLQSVIGKFSAPSSSMYRVCTGYVQGMYRVFTLFTISSAGASYFSVRSFKVWYFSKASNAYWAREDISSSDLPSALVAMNSAMLGYSLCPMLRAVETINMMMMAPSPNLNAEFASNPNPASAAALK